MLVGVWMEKKYKEVVEVSIVGSVFTLFMVAITSSLNEPLCWPPDFFICPEMCQDINTAYCCGHTAQFSNGGTRLRGLSGTSKMSL
jgi:hypothetical protein